MIKFSGNLYYSKNKIYPNSLITTTGEGLEADLALEAEEKAIAVLLEKAIKKHPKIDTKGYRFLDDKKKAHNTNKVYFIEFENLKWLESSKTFKGEIVFSVIEAGLNLWQMKKSDIAQRKADEKALRAVVKEEV